MLTFFNENFGRHLVPQTGDLDADATRALSANHTLKKGGVSRLAAGWGIVRPGRATLQLALTAEGLEYCSLTRAEAFLAELEQWDGTPRIFLEFDKRPVPVANLFRTFDVRQVRICTPRGVETFDFTKEPTADSGKMHKIIWRLKEQRLAEREQQPQEA